MTTIGRIEQLTTISGGYVETTSSARPPTFTTNDLKTIRVDREEFKAVLDRLQTLEQEIRTLKDQMKVCESAASLVRNRG
jgi:hypothetical protein